MTGLKRGVSVSQFLANGNALSPSTTNYPPSDDLDLGFDADLSKFTNLEWSEFDLNGGGGTFDADEGGGGTTADAANKRLKMETSGRDEAGADGSTTEAGETDWTAAAAQYNPFDLATAGAQSMAEYDAATTTTTTALQHQTGPTSTTTTTAGFPSVYPTAAAPLAHHAYPPHHQAYPSTASAASPAQSLEDNPAARAAAEEDKRRRNTAASARFRVKKKQREQALEKTADELKTKAAELEQQVGQLKRENEWLRGLVVLKSGETAKKEGGRKGEGEEEEEGGAEAKGEEKGKQQVESKPEKLKKGYGTES